MLLFVDEYTVVIRSIHGANFGNNESTKNFFSSLNSCGAHLTTEED